MLTPGRALNLNSESGRPLPKVVALNALYNYGTTPRFGEVTMVVGRSGSQKSGFALWYWEQVSQQLDLPALYFSADMSPFTASSRIASTRTGLTLEEIEAAMASGGTAKVELLEETSKSKIQFAFGTPITGEQIDRELDAYVEIHDAFPPGIIFDNLMDFEGGAESDYTAQMAVMQNVTTLARDTGAATWIMHHASDKSWDAKTDPFNPPSRQEVKGGLSEKPALTLSVALDPNTMDFRMATIKQRMGPNDPTGRNFVTLTCEPERTRFHMKGSLVR